MSTITEDSNKIINELKMKINEEKNIQKKNKINKLIELTSNYINKKEAYAILIHFDNLL